MDTSERGFRPTFDATSSLVWRLIARIVIVSLVIGDFSRAAQAYPLPGRVLTSIPYEVTSWGRIGPRYLTADVTPAPLQLALNDTSGAVLTSADVAGTGTRATPTPTRIATATPKPATTPTSKPTVTPKPSAKPTTAPTPKPTATPKPTVRPTVTPPALVDSDLWVADEHRLRGYTLPDVVERTTIRDIDDFKRIDIDLKRHRVWVLTDDGLRVFDSKGNPWQVVPLAFTAPGDSRALRVNSVTGTVWVGVGRKLYRVSVDGVLTKTVTLANAVRAIAVDTKQGTAWIATDLGLSTYTDSGGVVNNPFPLSKPDIKDIDIDSSRRQIWIAEGSVVRRYHLDTATRELTRTFKNAALHLRHDGRNGGWIATRDKLSHLDATGQPLSADVSVTASTTGSTPTPVGKEAHVVALAAVAKDTSVWVATESQVYHYASDLRKIDGQTIRGSDIEDIALATNSGGPSLSFIAPLEGAVVTSPTPSLALGYNDAGVGIDPQSVRLTVNGSAFSTACQVQSGTISCDLLSPLPEGPGTLTATVTNVLGEISAPATVHITVRINHAPQFTSSPLTTATVGKAYSYDVDASDADNDPLSFSLITKPAGMAIDSATGVIVWTPLTEQAGAQVVSVRVTDNGNLFATQSYTIQVASAPPVNQPPKIVSTPVTSCTVPNPTTRGPAITLAATVRDFQDSQSDFDGPIGTVTTGLVQAVLGADGKPQFAGSSGAGGITGAASFDQWFNDTAGINSSAPLSMTLTQTASGSKTYAFDSAAFFPIDNQLLGNQGRVHNFQFTVEAHSSFTYRGGETFEITGDHDAWLYINNGLAIDLGGRHAVASGSISLDTLGLTVGQTYAFDLFLAQRQTISSQLKAQTVAAVDPTCDYRYDVDATDPENDPISYGLVNAPSGMRIDSASGLITWHPNRAQAGVYDVLVRASDNHTGVADQAYKLTVTADHPPTIVSTPITSATVGLVYRYTARATDPDLGDTLTYALVQAPIGMSIDVTSGAITWTPSADQIGESAVTLRVNDPAGLFDIQDFVVTVADPVPINRPPVVNSSPVTTASAGTLYTYDVDATDPDVNDALVYSLPLTAPAGMQIDPTTGVITWTPSATQGGNHLIEVKVTDRAGLFVTQSFTVSVTVVPPPNNLPTIVSTPNTVATVGQPYAYDVDATDADSADTLSYSLTVNPTGMSINSASGLINWIPNASQSGPQAVTVQVNDGHAGGTTSQSFNIEVTAGNSNNMAPRALANSYTVGANQILTIPAPGVLGNDSDPENDALTAHKLSDPMHGSLNFNANGSFTFSPNADNQACTALPAAPGISFTQASNAFSFPINEGPFANVYGLARGDFNMDGFIDLAFTGRTARNVDAIWLLLGKGDNTFQTPRVVESFASSGLARYQGILARDVDGDCKLDLFVVSDTPREIRFFKGEGDGTFDAAVPTLLPQGGVSLQSGDVNGDGKLDLVTAGRSQAVVSVLLGKGDGTFQTPVDYAVSQLVGDHAIGDVNGDGALDIVVSVSQGTTSTPLNVLLNKNDGSGSFKAAQQYPTNMVVGGFYLADFNGDSKLDVVAGGVFCRMPDGNISPLIANQGCMTFIPGNGDGTFSVPSGTPPATSNMAHFAFRGALAENLASDVNGDGKLDVVFGQGNVDGNLLHVRLGNGDGTFTTSAWVASPGPVIGPQPLEADRIDSLGGLGSTAIADFNSDGVMDIAAAMSGSVSAGRIGLLPGTTPGRFASARIYPVLEPPFTSLSFNGNVLGLFPMTLGDFTNDGQPELAIVGGFNQVGVMPLAADGSLGAVTTAFTLPVPDPAATRIHHADFDGDGNLDVVWIGADGFRRSAMIVAYGNGSGQFADPVVISPTGNTQFINLITGDFNNDGFPDIAAYTGLFRGGPITPVAIDIYLSTGGSRSFALHTPAGGSTLGNYNATNVEGMVTADFDQDGVLDLVVNQGAFLSNQNDPQRSLFLHGNGDGTFQAAVAVATGIQSGITDYAVADVNHDDKLDLVGLRSSFGVAVQLGNGDGTFRAPVSYDLLIGGAPGQVALADFDSDGHTDIVATIFGFSNGGAGVAVLKGLGDGTFNGGQKLAIGTSNRSHTSLLVADVNNDGRPDLISGGADFHAQDFTVLLNNSAKLGACTLSDSFTYAANDGSLDSPPVTVRLTIEPVNHPPVIASAPVTTANSGQMYGYDVNATDPDATDKLTYGLRAAPTGMSIDASTGVIQWLPATTQAGPHTVTVRAFDNQGVFAEQSFTLTVIQRARVPNVVGLTQAAAQAAITGAGLIVGTVTTRNNPTVPAGSVISQTPAAGLAVAANTAVNLIVSLGPLVVSGLTAITVTPNAPAVLVGGTLAFTAIGTTSNGSFDITDGVSWSSVTTSVATINPLGVASGVNAGSSTISATLGSITGNATLTVRSSIAGDTTLPTAIIATPTDGADVTSPINVIGTATDENFFRYELAYALAGDTHYTMLGTGATPVNNGTLGRFDPTLLVNDLYDLKLSVFDLGGNRTDTVTTVQVNRELKLGLFTIGFQDLNIPVSGIPITINRTYDSRDKGQGDFGIGWRLDIQSLRIRPNREQGSSWIVNRTGGLAGVYALQGVGEHKVSLTLPGGKVEEFDLTINPSVSPLVPLQTVSASYVARPGTLGNLVSLDDNDLLVVGDQPGNVTLVTFAGANTYNPKRFRYTAPDGKTIDIDRTQGVQKVQDLNGNSLTFGPGGITHSSGKSVVFTRDPQGRITQITDPSGNARNYSYDANGDLVAATDFGNNTTRFTYNRTHGLVDINDPTGTRVARNEYDADGRLIATTDAKGNRVKFSHNLNARQEVTTDRIGNITVYEYDDAGNVVAKTDALGNRSTYTHDSWGNQLTETDPLGRIATKTYDTANNVLTSTDFDGNTTTNTYNARKQLLTTTDPEGHVTTNVYDANGNLSKTTDPEGGVTTYTYDGAGNNLSATDPLGNVTRSSFNATGERTTETDALGTVSAFTYDANGSVLSKVKAGRTTQYQYDANKRSVKITDPLGHATLTSYGLRGDEQKPESVTDPNGHVTHMDYDVSVNLTRKTFADNSTEDYTYDAENRLLSTTNRDRHTTTFEYDALGRQTKVINPDGTTVTKTYDAVGRVLTQTDERGNVTTYRYRANEQTVIDALGNVTVHQFDSKNRRIKTTDALSHVSLFAYDSKGALLRTTFPDGTTKTASYDPVGNKISETDQAGVTIRYTYDVRGRLVTVTDALNQTTTYVYDSLDNRIEQTDANGHTTKQSFDLAGRLVSRVRPLGQEETFAYDANGNQITHTDFNGKTTTYGYDTNNLQLSKVLPDSTVVAFTYTPGGLRTSAGGDSYTYDARGRLVQEIKSTAEVLTYTYDAAGNKTALMTAQGTTNYAYDGLNRLISVTDQSGNTTYSYDAVGNLTTTSYPNGTSTAYTYDTLNRLTQLSNSNSSGVISLFSYTLGTTGNRLKVVESNSATTGRTVSYSYDPVYRLTQEIILDPVSGGNQTFSYSYDAVGNRLQMNRNGAITTYTYDANDRLLEEVRGATSVTSSYDNNGNLLSRGSALGGDTYTYDADSRLISANTQAGGTVTFTYDADGMRTGKTVAGVKTAFLLDKNRENAQVVVETTGATTAVYTYGNQCISQTRAGEGTHFYLSDGSLSTRHLTTTAGLVSDTYTYDAFGVTLAATGPTQNTYLYSGEQLDPNTGFYYLRARYYDQNAGRFASTDPLQGNVFEPVSLHRYLYANANPITFHDPSGMYNVIQISAGLTAISLLANVVSFGATLVGRTDIAVATGVISVGTGLLASAINPQGAIYMFFNTASKEGWLVVNAEAQLTRQAARATAEALERRAARVAGQKVAATVASIAQQEVKNHITSVMEAALNVFANPQLAQLRQASVAYARALVVNLNAREIQAIYETFSLGVKGLQLSGREAEIASAILAYLAVRL